jgi:hypothetical protein
MTKKLHIQGDFENDFVGLVIQYFGDVKKTGDDWIEFEVDYNENQINTIITNLPISVCKINLTLSQI